MQALERSDWRTCQARDATQRRRAFDRLQDGSSHGLSRGDSEGIQIGRLIAEREGKAEVTVESRVHRENRAFHAQISHFG